MSRLLKIFCVRLRKDKIFWLALAIVFGISLYISLTNAPEIAEWVKVGSDYSLEDFYYNLAPILGLFFAAFVSLFLGVEYSDGTLRNKLIAGHGRSGVFLAAYITSALACLCLTVVFMLAGLFGLCWFDGFGFGWKIYAMTVVILICSALFFAAIFTLLSLLISNKAFSTVVCLVLWVVLLILASKMLNLLSEPPMTQSIEMTVDGFVFSDDYPNPLYISGTKRTVLEFITHILPTAPAIRMAGNYIQQPVMDIICPLVMTVVVLFIGCILFRKKDLK